MSDFKKLLTKECKSEKWFITGGAGFIGSHLVDLLVSAGYYVTVYDNLSLSTNYFLQEYIKAKKIIFYKNDMRDLDALVSAMKGHTIVWHLGANTDIPSGFKSHTLDLDNNVIATCNVLEAMLKNNVQKILFSSTGAVYGEHIKGTFKESSGPLVPLSLYAASKIASEGFISSYCHLYGIKAWIFRLGNVIGGRINHGIIFDFLEKLKKNPKKLEILGTGIGEKNYFLVEECIHGMVYAYQKASHGPFPMLVNLGTDSTSKIMSIARIILEEMELASVHFSFTGTSRGWPGDQPVVLLDTTKIHRLGWRASRTSDEAVRIAVRRLLHKEDFALSINTHWHT